MKDELVVAWFSAGVSSAIATKLYADKLDKIFYIHIDDQHPDTLRFVRDCESWFGKPITILRNDRFKSVEDACRMGYINGPSGAICTRILKKEVRKKWEREQSRSLVYVWGMDSNEQKRASRVSLTMPEQKHKFPLVEQGITKEEAHKILRSAGIKRPEMYELGYMNNNCVGCVKGGMGYWNRIRVDFPDVFERRSRMERLVGASCIRGIYLDELDPERGRNSPPIVDDCGILCELKGVRV